MAISELQDNVQPLTIINKTNELVNAANDVDTTLSITSTNPVQNKVITEALDNKASIAFIDWTVS